MTGQIIKTPTVSTTTSTKTFNDRGITITTDFTTNEKSCLKNIFTICLLRWVTSEECVNLKLINSNSITVVDTVSKNNLPVNKALEKKIIDSTGHYISSEGKISMQEAIEKGLIIFEEVMDPD